MDYLRENTLENPSDKITREALLNELNFYSISYPTKILFTSDESYLKNIQVVEVRSEVLQFLERNWQMIYQNMLLSAQRGYNTYSLNGYISTQTSNPLSYVVEGLDMKDAFFLFYNGDDIATAIFRIYHFQTKFLRNNPNFNLNITWSWI